MRFFRDLTLLVLVLGGAIGFSQVPRFVQEYEQRLGGALQEARRQLDRYDELARSEGLPVEALGRRLAASADPAVAGMGRVVAEQAGRVTDLMEQADALAAASRFLKPLILLQHHDAELLAATWAKFEYTLTLDVGFAALGALVGLVVNALLWAVPGRRAAKRLAHS
jgi:hypothetical protein